VAIEVRDTGSGIPPEVLARVREPFFTTKPSGEGLGLGLSICDSLARSCGGSMEIDSQPGAGTTVRLVLPGARAKTALPPPLKRPPAEAFGRVLVIDDERIVLQAMRRTLREHDVVCVENVAEALQLLERGDSFDVIVCDLAMPQMTGIDFYHELLRVKPAYAHRVLFVTGGVLSATVEAFLAAVPNLCIWKPFNVEAFRDTIRRLVATARHID
jgi:CheY-like chemotaxis protein